MIQSMTNTDTSDIDATVNQIKIILQVQKLLSDYKDTEALKAIPEIKENFK